MSRRTQTFPEAYFAGSYADDLNPWRFTSSAYERDESAATLAARPRARYRSAFEPAGSIGVFTHAQAARCDQLLATDLVPAAVDAARARCAHRANVAVRQGAVPADWPAGRFDLIVLSAFLYVLAPPDLAARARHVGDAIAPGGDLPVHWLGVTDDPQTGDGAAEGFIALAAPFAGPLHQSRTAAYRIDVLCAGSPA